jgi:hypothetical protein
MKRGAFVTSCATKKAEVSEAGQAWSFGMRSFGVTKSTRYLVPYRKSPCRPGALGETRPTLCPTQKRRKAEGKMKRGAFVTSCATGKHPVAPARSERRALPCALQKKG